MTHAFSPKVCVMTRRRAAAVASTVALLGVIPSTASADPSSQQPVTPPGLQPPTDVNTSGGTLPTGAQGGAAGVSAEGTSGETSPSLLASAEGALPFTGFQAGIALLIGGALAGTGLAIRRTARSRDS